MLRVRVLIVDDNAAVRDGIRIFLEQHEGFTVCGEAMDGLEGIKKTFELKPDVVLLDLSMPNLNGMEATHLIREGFPRAEIVIVTNHSSLGAARLAASVGASGFVTKPLIATDLVPMIDEVMRKHAA